MQTNQFHSSGKTTYKFQLEKELLSQKRKILQSKNLSKEEKKTTISTLEKSFLRKKKRLDYFNF